MSVRPKISIAAAIVLGAIRCVNLYAAPPVIGVEFRQPDAVRLSWLNSAPGYVLEEASSPKDANWNIVPFAPAPAATASIDRRLTGFNRFFRLRDVPSIPLTRIHSRSPASGELGVSVNREIVLEFTLPLASGAVLTTDHFFATFSGRRFLSRVELSSDRRKATLFFLESIPPSTRINVAFDGTGLHDLLGRLLDADGDGLTGGTDEFTYDTFGSTPVSNTAVIGRVFASELMPGNGAGANTVNRPLPGVTITVDGAEETLRTTTDAQGRFRLEPAPAGRFFVHVDGRTSPLSQWPGGAYYPFVGKAWEAVPGREDNLAGGTGEIFLPLIAADTLQPVSSVQDTTIAMPPALLAENPAFVGVNITVPANALFSDNGARGGMVGLAPVPSDRLPGPLPPGLNMPLVITVQTDGPGNFDRPAPVCFPNTPDELGNPLPPGARAALMSFNHDTGEWERAGSMTVSLDGRLICSDEGSGIRQPGWHGRQFPDPEEYPGRPPLPPPPPPLPICPDPLSEVNFTPADPHAPCQPCDPTTQQANLNRCLAKAAIRNGFCQGGGGLALRICPVTGPNVLLCLGGAGVFLFGCEVALIFEVDDCIRNNPPCSSPLAGAPLDIFDSREEIALANSPEGVPLNQLRSLLMSLADLLRPYLDQPETMPAEVLAQANLIQGQIRELAGDDLVEFARSELIRQESKAVRDFGPEGEFRGDQPPYPVHYAAIVRDSEYLLHCNNQGLPPLRLVRPGHTNVMRGLTKPYAQYELFLRGGPVLDLGIVSRLCGGSPLLMPIYASELLSVRFYDPITKQIGEAFPRRITGLESGISGFTLSPLPASALDTDQDGAADVVEEILGTNPNLADSDGDGIVDGAEIDQGLNPLDGRPVATGVIASAPARGTVVDVAAFNETAAFAALENGVSIFNAVNGQNPVLTAQVDTPGQARAVAIGNGFVAVADGTAGLGIVRLLANGGAELTHTFPQGSPAISVAAADGLAFAGLENGTIVMADIASGVVLQRMNVGERVDDLGFEGDVLFAATSQRLRAFRLSTGALTPVGDISHGIPYHAESITGRRRLFVNGGIAYITGFPGYGTFDVTNAVAMRPLGLAVDFAPNSFKQIVVNGSGSGLCVVGVTPQDLDPATHNVQLWDTRDPLKTTEVITQFDTPGLARAVTIFKGLAYVADGDRGLQIINYLPYDSRTNAPTVALRASFQLEPAQVESGRFAYVAADVTDDVQVRDVEFHVDGQRAILDGNAPFEYHFTTPSSARSSFRIRAKATDTGGNATWTPEITVSLLPDATPPHAMLFIPEPGGFAGVTEIALRFNEPIDAGTLTSARFRVLHAGADQGFGTSDDVAVSGPISYNEAGHLGILSFSQALPAGNCRVFLDRGVTDLSGNAIPDDVVWAFRSVFGLDSDHDGLTDAFEAAQGLNPFVADSNGNGIADRLEDPDQDGASNFAEMILGSNPANPRSLDPNLLDGQVDRDGDYLTDAREVLIGTDPFRIDTDGDLFSDDAEVLVGTDPIDRQKRPLGWRKATSVDALNRRLPGPTGVGLGGILASPPVQLLAPGQATPNGPRFILGQPPVDVRFE